MFLLNSYLVPLGWSGVLEVSPSEQGCKQNGDCVGISLNCGDCICGQAAVNKQYESKYQEQAEQYCQDHHKIGLCDNQCLPLPNIKCLNNQCVLMLATHSSEKTCEADSDCVEVVTGCGGCDCENDYDAVNKVRQEYYLQALDKICSQYIVENCEINCGYLSKCVNGQCNLTKE